jgi:hypothetical protein
MGNDNMVTNQKVFIRLEKVLELQRVIKAVQTAFWQHSAVAAKSDVKNEEAYDAMYEAKHGLEAMQRVIAILELPITL